MISFINNIVHSNAFVLTALGALFLLQAYAEIRHYKMKKEIEDERKKQAESQKTMPSASKRTFKSY